MKTETRNAYEEKADAKLKKLKAQMTLLEADFEEAKADVRIKYTKQLDKIRDQYQKAKMRLDKMADSTQDAWKELRTGVDQAINELEEAIGSASDRIST
jgi:hypothetical protein